MKAGGPAPGRSKSLYQGVKLLDGELGGFQNVRECAAFYRSMGGDSNSSEHLPLSVSVSECDFLVVLQRQTLRVVALSQSGRKIGSVTRSQYNFPNLFSDSGKVIVYGLKI